MKTIGKKFRDARDEVKTITNNYILEIRVCNWLRECGLDTIELSPWNFDSGICYHKPTGRAISRNWSKQQVEEFCKSIGIKNTKTLL